MTRWLPRRLLCCRRGTAAVDFAMVSVVFLPLCFEIMELGIVLWVQNTLETTAELMARCAATQNTACSDARSIAVSNASEVTAFATVTTS